MGYTAHKDNPLSNPEDRKHYLSRLRTEVGRKGGLATAERLKAPAALAERRATLPKPVPKAKTLSLRNQILYGPLRTWMQGYALWLCQQSPPPGIERRVAHINYLSKQKANRGHVRLLERRVDFQEFVDLIGRDALAAARAQYLDMLPLASQVQRQILEQALAEPTPANLRVASRFLEGAAERFFPKKAPESDTKKVVHVHLSGKHAEALQREASLPEIVVAEPEIEEPPALPSGPREPRLP